MLKIMEKAKKTLSWLFEKPLANTMPSLYVLDRAMIVLFKTTFIIIRIFSKITLQKNKMTFFQFQRKCHINADVNFSFYLFMFIYKLINTLRLGNPSLIKIHVHKYNYKVYCPATVDDFINMTTREQDILEYFNPKKNDTVVDIGAHLGRYALISSNLVGKEGKVVTIEANPLVFEELKKNLELNKVTNTICLNYAVFSEKTKIKLFVRKEESTNTEYSLRNTVMIDRDKLMVERSKNAERILEVNADTLDNLLDLNDIKHENINWIKIDGTIKSALATVKLDSLQTSCEATLDAIHQVEAEAQALSNSTVLPFPDESIDSIQKHEEQIKSNLKEIKQIKNKKAVIKL